MKNFLIILLTALVLATGFFLFSRIKKASDFAEIKEGWHVEITTDYINVRERPDRFSNSYQTVKKGEIYKVLDINLENANHFWYHIQIDEDTTGWIANPRTENYLIDNNNPSDIAAPTIKLADEDYIVNSIDDISYDHLTLWDDREGYEVTHTVYHEINLVKNIDQYWIKYTITDKEGKSSSKTEKIYFTVKPNENEVLDFNNYTK